MFQKKNLLTAIELMKNKYNKVEAQFIERELEMTKLTCTIAEKELIILGLEAKLNSDEASEEKRQLLIA